MNVNRSSTAGAIILLIAVVSPGHLLPQSTPKGEPVPSLQKFYQRLVEHYNPSSLPKEEERVRVMDQVQAAPADEISKALPWIFTALAHQDDQVKLVACGALLRISFRPDSAALLKSHIKPIGDLLISPDERLQWGGLQTLSYLKPLPPPEAVAPVLAFLKRTDANTAAQAGAMSFLLSHAPDNVENVGAVLNFLDRPLDRQARLQALQALGYQPVTNPNIIERVIAGLGDRDSVIRWSAAKVLPRMGRRALLLARPELERLAEDPDQPGDVKEEARKDLEILAHER